MRFDAESLVSFASAALEHHGLSRDRAHSVAQTLLEGDLLGHDTHGLALLRPYLGEIETGGMQREGDWETISDTGPTALWDGRRLPGPWLVHRAIEQGATRAPQYGSFSVVIRRSHHIACLAAYLKRATDRGLVLILASSDPSVASVAPFGGTERLYTPNPLAAGIPTDNDPILMDISMSTTTNGMVTRTYKEGVRLPHPWLLDSSGQPTDDPGVFFADPPGSILPLGGLDTGHKGFALGILIEAVTGGLGGFGRADPKEGWGAAVFLLMLDPARFGGRDAFVRETGFLARAARRGKPRPGSGAVRMPGERGLRLRAEQLTSGVRLNQHILTDLRIVAAHCSLQLPDPVDT